MLWEPTSVIRSNFCTKAALNGVKNQYIPQSQGNVQFRRLLIEELRHSLFAHREAKLWQKQESSRDRKQKQRRTRTLEGMKKERVRKKFVIVVVTVAVVVVAAAVSHSSLFVNLAGYHFWAELCWFQVWVLPSGENGPSNESKRRFFSQSCLKSRSFVLLEHLTQEGGESLLEQKNSLEQWEGKCWLSASEIRSWLN